MNGYGFALNPILSELRIFSEPSNACGWACDEAVPHIHTVVRPPLYGFFSQIAVETPFKTYGDHMRRVSDLGRI